MKIKIKMRCKEFIKLSVPLLAASRSALRFSTPSGHHLQARKVGRRIQSLTRIPPGLGPWIEGSWRRTDQTHGLGTWRGGGSDEEAGLSGSPFWAPLWGPVGLLGVPGRPRRRTLPRFDLEFKISLLKQTSLFEFKRRQHCQSRTSWDGLESDKAERNFILSLVGWPGIG